MSYVLRKIHKPWWYKDQSDNYEWLTDGELVSDIFRTEMATEDGKLSIYALDEDRQNLSRIAAALACTRDFLQNLDFVVLPKDLILNALVLQDSPGDTPDETVNKWHVDIVHLTPSKLTDLTYLIRDHRHSFGRFKSKQLDSAILEGIGYGHISLNRVSEPLRQKLSEKICQVRLDHNTPCSTS